MIKLFVVVILTASFVISAVFVDHERVVHDALESPWWHYVVLFVAGLALTILCSYIVFGSNKDNWEGLAWSANPFDKKQPLQFFHLLSWLLILAGLSLYFVDYFRTNIFSRDAMYVLVTGIGIRVGTYMLAPACTPEEDDQV